jgi:hypothetical protein
VDAISNSLRGHLSFIASDLLKTRFSSRGWTLRLNIAAQFRRAGLSLWVVMGIFRPQRRVAEQDLRTFHFN